MTPAPPVGKVAERTYDRLQIYAPDDEARGWPLRVYLGGLGLIFQPLDDVVRERDDGTDGLAAFMDPQRTFGWALAWLAMFAGVQLPKELSEVAQREALKQTPAQDRGSLDAIIGAARRHLTDPVNGLVFVDGRFGGDPYETLVVTRAAQTPDPEALKRAVESVLHYGVRLTYQAATAEVIEELVGTVAAQVGTIDELLGL